MSTGLYYFLYVTSLRPEGLILQAVIARILYTHITLIDNHKFTIIIRTLENLFAVVTRMNFIYVYMTC